MGVQCWPGPRLSLPSDAHHPGFSGPSGRQARRQLWGQGGEGDEHPVLEGALGEMEGATAVGPALSGGRAVPASLPTFLVWPSSLPWLHSTVFWAVRGG